jgi:hypothetical protein
MSTIDRSCCHILGIKSSDIGRFAIKIDTGFKLSILSQLYSFLACHTATVMAIPGWGVDT